ncbi:hypothetical protein TDB9533_04510 [Thalassocella blandensis]|nr:hypothetical protein TDB9533_04510 [Thalassocella blandensis]
MKTITPYLFGSLSFGTNTLGNNILGTNVLSTEHRRLLGAAFLVMCSMLCSVYSAAEMTLYRYTDDQGIQVIDHAIPPELVKNGYEVIDINGRVVRVVAPARTAEEIKAEAERKRIATDFERLKKRYASVADLESAKERKLESIDTAIAILESNIHSISKRKDELMSLAANQERAGRKVSQDILNKLETAKAEMEVAESSLNARRQEYQDVVEKFEAEVAIFEKGKALLGSTN